MNYFKDFKRERFHDENLIKLVEILSQHNGLDAFEHLLGIPVGACGNFIRGYTKRDFDVLLEFEKYQVLIETKVDSPEGDKQTERIYNEYQDWWSDKKKIFVYLTYGLSEFYIKKKGDGNGNYGNGAYDTNFIHIKCPQIHDFIDKAITKHNITDASLTTWNNWLKFEITKRTESPDYLLKVNDILKRYKAPLNLTDYPTNRLNLFLPEFTIPFYFELCQSWNSHNNETLGKACLYPVGRGYSPVNDSVLNFWELWTEKSPLTCKGILDDNFLYFEFNEDFNLHLKADSDTPNIDKVKEFISSNADKLSVGFSCIEEDYHQGAHVLFEWNLDLLSCTPAQNVANIEKVLTNAVSILN